MADDILNGSKTDASFSLEGTQLVSSTAILPQNKTLMCKKHPSNTMTHLCKECRVAVCTVCIDDEHKGHNCAPLCDSSRMLEKMLQAEGLNVECALENVQDVANKLTHAKDDTLKSHNDNIAAIKERRDELIEDINRKSQGLIDQLMDRVNADTQAFDTSIADTSMLLTKGTDEQLKNLDTVEKDPDLLLSKVSELQSFANDCITLSRQSRKTMQRSPKFSLKVSENTDVFNITLASDDSTTDVENDVPQQEPTEENTVDLKKTGLPVPSAFHAGICNEVSSRIDKGYLYVTTGQDSSDEKHEIYLMGDDSFKYSCTGMEPEATESGTVKYPTVCGDNCLFFESYPNYPSWGPCIKISVAGNLSRKKSLAFSFQIKAISRVDEATALILQSSGCASYLQEICLANMEFLNRQDINLCQQSQWDIIGPLLITTDKSLIFFATKSSTKRALKYNYNGQSGRTIFMPDEMLKFSHTAVIDDVDQIWIGTDEGEVKRYKLDGSETLNLDLGNNIYHLMTDGVAMYVHYMDKENQRRFDKIEIGA